MASVASATLHLRPCYSAERPPRQRLRRQRTNFGAFPTRIGFADLERYGRRQRVLIASGIVLAGAALTTILGVVAGSGEEMLAAAFLGVAGAAFVLFPGALIAGLSASYLTEQGEAAAARWRAFASY